MQIFMPTDWSWDVPTTPKTWILVVRVGGGLNIPVLSLSSVLEGIEGLVGVADERQAHLCILLGRDVLGVGAMHGAVVFLRNFVYREIGNIDVGGELGFERSANASELVPDDATEEWMTLD